MKIKFNLGLGIASVFVALMLWAHVRSEAALNVTRKVDFAVRYFGLNEDKFVVKTMPKAVAVEVEGTAEELDRFALIKPASLLATVDLSEAAPEVVSYRVRLPKNEAIDRTGVTMKLVSDEVAVIVEEVLDKEMEVTVDPYNAPPGLMFASAEIKPDKVRIRGPLGDLSQVDQVRARVDLSSAISAGVSVTLEVIDRNERPVEAVRSVPSEVTVTPQLAKVAPTKNALVSIELAQSTRPAIGYRLTDITAVPATVPVRGEMNQLASLKAVSTEPIRLDNLMGSTVIKARLVVPKGLRIERTTVDVRVKIEAAPQPPPNLEGQKPNTKGPPPDGGP